MPSHHAQFKGGQCGRARQNHAAIGSVCRSVFFCTSAGAYTPHGYAIGFKEPTTLDRNQNAIFGLLSYYLQLNTFFTQDKKWYASGTRERYHGHHRKLFSKVEIFATIFLYCMACWGWECDQAHYALRITCPWFSDVEIFHVQGFPSALTLRLTSRMFIRWKMVFILRDVHHYCPWCRQNKSSREILDESKNQGEVTSDRGSVRSPVLPRIVVTNWQKTKTFSVERRVT